MNAKLETMKALRELSELLASDRYSYKRLADGTGVLLDLESMSVLSFNRTGMFVLEQIAGGTADLVTLERRLIESFEVDAATAARDLQELLDRLDRLLPAPARP